MTRVNDLIIASKYPQKHMAKIEQEFVVRNIQDSPSHCLGSDLKCIGDKIHISSGKHVTEVLHWHQDKHGTLKKENPPISPDAHPELDDSDLLNDDQPRRFQHIIGMSQWLVVAGCFGICHAVFSPSRFQVAPRKGHLNMAERTCGHMEKHPKHGHMVNPAPPQIDIKHQRAEMKNDFGDQHHCFHEDIDPK